MWYVSYSSQIKKTTTTTTKKQEKKKKKARAKKQKKEMNTSQLAHISISIFVRCHSRLSSVDAASYFLAGRHRRFFCCPTQKVQKKKHKKEGEKQTTHFFRYVCVRLVSWSSEHTHSPRLFFPSFSIVYQQNEQKKLSNEECASVHTHRETRRRKKR